MRVRCPAAFATIVEVVRVLIVDLLDTVEAFTIEPILGLEHVGKGACTEVVIGRETEEEGEGKTEYYVDGHRRVGLGNVTRDQEFLQ